MDDSMVENAARALFWMNGQYAERGMKTWGDATPLVREKLIKEARAVIDTMREPTPAMIEACVPVWRTKAPITLDEDCGNIWQAMIDAALAQGTSASG